MRGGGEGSKANEKEDMKIWKAEEYNRRLPI